MGIIHYNIPSGADLSILKPEYYTNPGVLSPVTWAYSLGRDRFDEKFINENKNYYQNPIETTYEFGDILVYWHCYGDGQVACNVKARGSSTNLIAFTHDNSTGRPVIEYYLDFAIDTENQKGYFVVISLQHVANRNQWQEFIWLADGGNTLYNLLLNQPFTSNGGGATHIAKVTGQLKDLSSNLSDILMVSGGGGGGLLLGDSGWHGTEEDLIWSGNNNKMTVLKDGNDIKFKFYTNGTAIYTVTSQLSDVSKIYVSFLADDENQVMKPSFIYETASGVYSYNQEEPTDEQMSDLYTWLSAGLTSN